jgi:pantoate--beta-alanine ligase
VISIFVNPAQFAPHEDLSSYPRTLPHDLALLNTLSPSPSSTAVFLPSMKEMYPSGITQEKEMQKGTFVDVMGFSHQMEGKSRPLFFRGVATVVTKLFNVVQASLPFDRFVSESALIFEFDSPRMRISVKKIYNKH